jgi:HlyD family secretion protein
MPSKLKLESTAVTLIMALALAAGITAAVHYLPGVVANQNVASGQTATSESIRTSDATGASQPAATRQSTWQASAAGRVEPKGGRVQVRPEASGTILQVTAAVKDRVEKGDILALLDSSEIEARIEAARAEVSVRVGERDEEPEKNTLLIERRQADDAVAKAERALHQAQIGFDRLFISAHATASPDATALENARKAIEDARRQVAAEKDKRAVILAKDGMPPPSRLDSGLAIARSDLRIAEIAYERTRVRATTSGTILDLNATRGEVANASAAAPIAVIGDVSELEVRAEVDERDVSKIFQEQSVVIRSNAFPGQDFTGKVTLVDPALGSPALKARGPRKPSDVDVLEVKIALDGETPLMPGMRVDVFFKKKDPVKAAASN